MTIRSSRPGDGDALAALAAVTFPLACPADTTEEAITDFLATTLSAARFEEYIADEWRRVLVDEVDGSIIAYTILVLGEPSDPDVVSAISLRPTAELSKCYVHPDHHGRGTAGLILARTLAAARSAGAAGVWAGTNEENGRAIRFYQKHGFTLVGTRTFRVGQRDESDVVLEYAFADAAI